MAGCAPPGAHPSVRSLTLPTPWSSPDASGGMLNPAEGELRRRLLEQAVASPSVLAESSVLGALVEFAREREAVLLRRDYATREVWEACWDHDRMERRVTVVIDGNAQSVAPAGIALRGSAIWNRHDLSGYAFWSANSPDVFTLSMDDDRMTASTLLRVAGQQAEQLTTDDLEPIRP